MTRISAPIFDFGDNRELTASDSLVGPDLPGGSFTLTGPSVKAEKGHLPVRGDLAHVKLAGRYFVPHYAVPMPHLVLTAGATLRVADKADAEAILELLKGDIFDVLDITGGWAWGQLGGRFGEDGPVGYIPMEQLERADT